MALEEALRSLRPAAVLDVGCGCGRELTSRLARHCPQVVGIDVAPHAPLWQQMMRSSGIAFCCMDAVALAFAGGSFPLVLERAALHHILRWEEALAEMIRVAAEHVLVEEPVDDLRSEAKRRTHEAQELLLELQAEVGYPHYRHLDPGALLSAIGNRGRILAAKLERSDAPLAFDDFFENFSVFASASRRERYWLGELDRLRTHLDGAPLCEDDVLTVLAAK